MNDKPPAATKVFFDTNVLVYQIDPDHSAKQRRALSLVRQHVLDETGVISTQVVQEFLNVALKKFKTGLSQNHLARLQDTLLSPLCRHHPDMQFYLRTLELYERYSLSFYDALIIQAAIDLDCRTLYSEDMQDGQKFGRLAVKNPFI